MPAETNSEVAALIAEELKPAKSVTPIGSKKSKVAVADNLDSTIASDKVRAPIDEPKKIK